MQILGKFNLELPTEKYKILLIEFQVLTPDSFIWRLLIDGNVYYLYAEDFVEGLADIEHKILNYAVKDAELDFIKARSPEPFNKATAVTHAVVYKEPQRSAAMMRYAVSSGHDFVFLCKSSEDGSHALFND